MTSQTRLRKLENVTTKSTPQKYVGPFDHLPIFCQMAPQCSDASWIQYAKPIATALVEKGYMPEGFQHLPDHFLCRWARLTGARLRAHDQRDDAKERQAECDERELFAEIHAFAAEQLRQEQQQCPLETGLAALNPEVDTDDINQTTPIHSGPTFVSRLHCSTPTTSKARWPSESTSTPSSDDATDANADALTA